MVIAAATMTQRLPGDSGPEQSVVPVLRAGEQFAIGGPDVADEYSFGLIRGVSVNDRGDIYVLDGLFRRVQVYDGSGRYMRSLGRRGWRPGEFQGPVSLALVRDSLLVIRDVEKGTYMVLGLSGAVVGGRADTTGGMLREGMQSDTLGHFFDSRRPYRDTSRPPVLVRYDVADLTRGPDTLRLPVYHRPTIVAAGPSSSPRGYAFQPLSPDLLWTILPGAWLATAVGDGTVISVYDSLGGLQHVIRGVGVRAPVPRDVRDAEYGRKRRELERYAAAAQVDAAELIREISIPEYYPRILQVIADNRGRIWVRVPARPEAGPSFKVYTATGAPLAIVQLPSAHGADAQTFAVADNRLFVVVRTADDVEVIKVFEAAIPN